MADWVLGCLYGISVCSPLWWQGHWGLLRFLSRQRLSHQVLFRKSRKPCMDFEPHLLLGKLSMTTLSRHWIGIVTRWSTDCPGDEPCVKTSGEELTQGVVITYVDDLLLTVWQYHIDAITKALLVKYVMKRSGSLPCDFQWEKPTCSESEGIDILGAGITRDAEGTVWCDQSKYILHCFRENGFIGVDGRVSLRKSYTPPSIDEKLGEEGALREKNDAMAACRKYIGQMTWLTMRTRPDIAACLGILA